MQIKTDRELLESYATDSNDAAFAELAARYSPMVHRTCLRVLGNASDAEDATQAAFLVLARKTGSLRQEGRLNGWLHRVARHVALQALRVRADRERRQEQAAVSQESMTMDAAEADTEVVFKAVDAELDSLSAILREAVILRYLRGLSEQEAAAQAGCAVSAMKWRTSDGIAKLRQRLAKRGVALSGAALAGLLTSEASAAIPETLLPSIFATVKAAVATTATATGLASVALGAKEAATSTAAMLAKGAMKAMFWNSVKTAAMVAMSVGVVVVVGLAAVQAVAEKAAVLGQAVIGAKNEEAKPIAAKLKPLQAQVQDVAPEAEDLIAALGGFYRSFSILPTPGNEREDVKLVAEIEECGKGSGRLSVEHLPCSFYLVCVKDKSGWRSLCWGKDRSGSGATGGAWGNTIRLMGVDPVMDANGRVVLAHSRSSDSETPEDGLSSKTKPALALRFKSITFQPGQFQPMAKKIETKSLMHLLLRDGDSRCVKVESSCSGKVEYYRGAESIAPGPSLSCANRISVLCSLSMWPPYLARVWILSGGTIVQHQVKRHILEGSPSHLWPGEIDAQGRVALFVQDADTTTKDVSKSRVEQASDALVLRLTTGSKDELPLKKNQIEFLQECPEDDLLQLLCVAKGVDVVCAFAFAPAAEPVWCRLTVYDHGKIEQQFPDVAAESATNGVAPRFAVLLRNNTETGTVASASVSETEHAEESNEIEGVLRVNTQAVPFKLANPAWAGRFHPVKSTMDSQGRLLLAVQQAKPNPDRRQVSEQSTSASVSIATAPRALVLEFGTK